MPARAMESEAGRRPSVGPTPHTLEVSARPAPAAPRCVTARDGEEEAPGAVSAPTIQAAGEVPPPHRRPPLRPQ